MCVCPVGFTGDPFTQCIIQQCKIFKADLIKIEVITSSFTVDVQPMSIHPCSPSPCGPNALCEERNNAGACSCSPEYIGNPYEGCRPECVLNSDCPQNLGCVNSKCRDPCPGTCGQNANCQVINHLPTCVCFDQYSGDPFRYCGLIQRKSSEDIFLGPMMQQVLSSLETSPEKIDVCSPSPCGPFSQCREINGQAVCSCSPGYNGNPPGCRPECTTSSECPSDRACVSQKCVNPCPTPCGQQSTCRVLNHSPICTCSPGFTGDPFTRCFSTPRKSFFP